MSYSIYTTEGFILSSAPSGEAGKVYHIYTKDFGLLRAHAIGVRHLKSKLRYNLEDYSHVSFSLVRGKEFWRITGAVLVQDTHVEYMVNGLEKEILSMRARILASVRRLVQGEERNDDLFKALIDLFSHTPSLILTEENLLAFETKSLAHVLASLGYIDLSTLSHMSQREMLLVVNKALRETHL